MIRTIAVASGNTNYPTAAQQHALDLAGMLGARLRVVSLRERPEPEAVELETVAEAVSGEFETPDEEGLMAQARARGISCDRSYRGEKRLRALLAEAEQCDLLVVGMPAESRSKDDPLAEEFFEEGLDLFHNANCSLLFVTEAPAELGRVLVVANGGLRGKQALRAAGYLAEKARARLAVLARERESAEAGLDAGAATQYLRGFDIPGIEVLGKVGAADSETELQKAADQAGADLVVVSAEPRRWFRVLRPTSVQEGTARLESRPVLVAR